MARKSTPSSTSASSKPAKKGASRAKSAKSSDKKATKATTTTTKKKTASAPATKKKTTKAATASKPATKKSPSKSAKPAGETAKKSPSKKTATDQKPESKAKTESKAKPSAKSKPAKPEASGSPAEATEKATKGSPKKSGGSNAKSAGSSSKPSKSSKSKSAAAKGDDSAGGDTAAARFRGFRQESSLTEMRAAAAKLASLAGLPSVKSSGDSEDLGAKKFRKVTKSPLSAKQLAEFKEILLLKRAQLVGDVSSMELEALMGGGSGSLSHLPQHMADQGSDVSEQSLSLDLAASQRDLLREIDAALERIENDTFGICTILGKPIRIERLRETPWARYSIEAARDIERSGRFYRPRNGQ